jgi:hypothetical protein
MPYADAQGMRTRIVPLVAVLTALCGAVSTAAANTSHDGWPPLTGMLLMNKQDQARPLDGRPGHDPFDGTQASYRCSSRLDRKTECVPDGTQLLATLNGVLCTTIEALDRAFHQPLDARCTSQLPVITIVPATIGHNELLGGHGNNVIHAGPAGDVIWGDYKPTGGSAAQVNYLYGGAGNDFIYASHGTNYIWTGGGRDIVHAHFGGGEIHCDSSTVTVYLSHMSRRHYRLFGCRHISYKTLGY